MTKRVYFESDDLSLWTQVRNCSPVEDGTFRVLLAETLFHPQGGGQLSDRGTISGIPVERVIIEGDEIIHITRQEVIAGDVLIEIDPAARDLHSRLHSAGHLISGIVDELGWYATKGHHWPGEGRVVFERRDNPQSVTPEFLEMAVNRIISEDAPRVLREDNGVRSVCFGSQSMRNCGGTHVKTAGQVGHIRILKLKEKKGLLSIQYDISA